jgi:O-antigen ligase
MVELPLAVAQGVQWLGVAAACLAAGAALVAPDRRLRAVAMAFGLALVPVLLLGDLWGTERFRDLRDDPAYLALLGGLGLVVVVGLAVLFARRPSALPLAVVAVLPFRIPIEVGDGTANLLVPLYLVIAGGVAAAVYRELRSPPKGAGADPARWLRLALAATLVLYGLQSAYSSDLTRGLENVAFFLVPFALMFRLLLEVRWTPALLTGVFAIAVVESLAFAGLGFWEYGARRLLWNPEVIAANQFQPYFRVNSVFWDPNIYGRYLVMVMITVVAAMLWSRDGRRPVAMAAILAVLWGGLLLTFSQSSIVALLAGLAALAALRWHLRWTAVAVGVGLVAALAFVLTLGSTVKVDLGSERSLERTTSGRADLIRGGIELAADRPLHGHGSGSFARSFQDRRKGGEPAAVVASHTEPVTVAAEQGLVGLAVYVVLLAAAGLTLLRGMEAVAPGLRHGIGQRAGRPPKRSGRKKRPDLEPAVARAAMAAAFFALLVHTLTYAAFLSDPLTWLLLALGGGLAAQSSAFRRSASSRTPSPRPGSRAWRAWRRNSWGLRPGKNSAAKARAR